VNPRLQAAAGPLAHSTFFLSDSDVRIGRDPSNSLAIRDVSVSRRHCLLSRDRDSFKLCDLESRNGTFVNGSAVSEVRLSHGDQISVGESVFVFLDKDETEKSQEFDVTKVRATISDDPVTGAIQQILAPGVLHLPPDNVHKDLLATSRIPDHVNALHKVSRLVHSVSNLNQLQEKLLKLVFEVVPAERGAILLNGTGNEKFSSLFVHPAPLKRADPARVSRTITSRVTEQGVAILAADVPNSEGLKDIESLATLRISSLLCVPLSVFQKVVGCIYLDSKNPGAPFNRDHLEWVASVASISAGGLENARRQLWLEQANLRLATEINLQHNMVGESNPMKEVYRFLSRVAPSDATVLIGGESGTGKELVSRAIHRNSPRANRPFVTINCAAIPDGLLESELFGYERGAFTGAVGQKKGKLEMAEGGVVFLDEIGELAPLLQVKLLRVLQEREFERLGGSRPISVDIRLIAATNKNLAQAVKDGTFREDLYYRLNVVSVIVPPLRERPDDIEILAEYFISKFAVKCKVKAKKLSPEAMSCLMSYDWPGNVRELENAIERALVLGVSEVIRPEDLPESLLEKGTGPAAPTTKYHLAVQQLKKQLILAALEEARGSYTEAARILGVHANYLHRLVRNLNLRTSIRSLPIQHKHSGTSRMNDAGR